MALAVSAARAAGLHSFVLDLGHADIARALIAECPPELAGAVLSALAHKDPAMLTDLLKGSAVAGETRDALHQLPALHGDSAVWKEAERLLGRTAAAAAMRALHDLWQQASQADLESVLRVDLGEVRGFAYYTGALFHLLADGPGEPFGSGGRYDDLLGRFGAPMPAAGFALDLDNLAWALRAAGREEPLEPRVLVALGERSQASCQALRGLGIGCVPHRGDSALAYAQAWGFSHILCRGDGSLDELIATIGQARWPVPAVGGAAAVRAAVVGGS